MGGDSQELIRVGFYLTREQHRWLRQTALDVGSNASEVLRGLLQPHVATPATPIPTALGSGHMGIPPGTTQGSRATVDVRQSEETP